MNRRGTAGLHAWRPAGGLILLSATVIGCAGKTEEAQVPVQKETAADEVLRIGDEWESRVIDKGILSPPSKISVFATTTDSKIELSEAGGTEQLVIKEDIELRSGATVQCRTEFSHQLQVQWGRRQGRAAVELTRPALSGRRNCQGMHPEPTLQKDAHRALFVLRSDRLVAVEPPLEDRVYLPD